MGIQRATSEIVTAPKDEHIASLVLDAHKGHPYYEIYHFMQNMSMLFFKDA